MRLLLLLALAGAAHAQEPLFVTPDPRSQSLAFIESVGDRVYFLADAVPDPTQIVGTWRTDGTTAGTEYVSGLNWVGQSTTAPDGTAYFVGLDSPENGGTGPRDVYRLDAAGPVRLTSFSGSGFAANPVVVGDHLYYTGAPTSVGFDVELYGYDLVAGEQERYDLNPGVGAGGGLSSSPFAFLVVGEALYFIADTADSPTPSDGRGLWRVEPGSAPVEVAARPGEAKPFELAVAGQTILASDGSNGMFRLEGGVLAPFGDLAGAVGLTTYGDFVYFLGNAANDSPDVGAELFRTDGTTVELVADILPNSGSDVLGSEPSDFFEHGGWLYFVARTLVPGTNRFAPRLWRTDGTTTEQIPDFERAAGPTMKHPGRDANEFTSLGPDLAFLCGVRGVGGTVCVLDVAANKIRPLDFDGVAGGLAAAGGRLVFEARSGSVGKDLHVYVPGAEPVSTVPVPRLAGNQRSVAFYNSVGIEFRLASAPSGSGTVTGARFESAPADSRGLPAGAPVACRWEVTEGGDTMADWAGAQAEIHVVAQSQCFGDDPTTATLYWRPTVGQGPFAALATDASGYETTPELRFTGTLGFGEFALVSDGVATASDRPPAAERRALVLAGPNPASGETRLRVEAGPGERVTVTLHDALGRRVATLHRGPAGTVRVPLAGLAPGVYLARMDGAEAVQVTVVR